MKPDSKPEFIFGIGSVNRNSNISELISFLRSAFRPSDFDMVEEILVVRETSLKKEYDLMEKKHGEAVLVGLEMEEKLEKNKKELESLMKDLRHKDEMILGLNNEMAELMSSKREADSEIDERKNRFKELDQRVIRLEKEIETLVSEFRLPPAKMESEKKEERPVRDETEEEVFGDEKLAGDNVELVEPKPKQQCTEKIHTSPGAGSTSSSPLLQQNGLQEADLHSFDVACGNGRPLKKQLVSESGSSGKLTGSSMARSSRLQFEDIIEIDDSDDENPEGDGTKSVSNARTSMHKRKRSSRSEFGSDDDDDIAPIGKLRMKQELASDVVQVGPTSSQKSVFVRRCGEKPVARRNSQVVSSSSDSDGGSDSGDENCTDSFIENMIADLQRRKENRAWAFEVDMRKAFESEDELCMNAVCALYRQRNSMAKSADNRGFNTFDARRATTLAELLTDGDPQRKLKKSDPKIIIECRKLALLYSKQLFEIYQKKEDPFFPCPNRDQQPTKIRSS